MLSCKVAEKTYDMHFLAPGEAGLRLGMGLEEIVALWASQRVFLGSRLEGVKHG